MIEKQMIKAKIQFLIKALILISNRALRFGLSTRTWVCERVFKIDPDQMCPRRITKAFNHYLQPPRYASRFDSGRAITR